MDDFDRKEPVFGTPPQPPAGRLVNERLTYDGDAGDLAKLAVVNILLTLVTLGIYRFWAKTRVRRYLWGHVSFQGDRLEYTGTGKELFIGLLVVLLILSPLIVASLAIDIIYAADPAVIGIKALVQLVLILFLIHVAIYRARRYRLSRTQWRGIRIGQTGSAWKYAWIAFGWMFVSMLTVWITYPVYSTRLQAYRTENTWFGDRRLTFHGRSGELMIKWFIALLLWLPTLSLSMIWYNVQEFRYFTSKTRLGGLSFESDLSTKSVIFVVLGYMLVAGLVVGLTIFGMTSFGLLEGLAAEPGQATDMAAAQFAVLPGVLIVAVILSVLQLVLFIHPMARLICSSVSVSGEEEFDRIAQSEQAAPGRGEGLADALDVGAI